MAGTYDAGASWNSGWGVGGSPFTSADQHSAAADVTDAPISGDKLVIDDIFVSVDTSMSVTFKEATSGTVVAGPFYLSANLPYQFTPRGKLKTFVKDRKLQVITSVSGNIMVLVSYHSEA